jgi:5-methylthioadenosine/S-adenosylhomocysteine deaminase
MTDAPAEPFDLLIENVTAVLGGEETTQYRIVPDTSIGVRGDRFEWIGTARGTPRADEANRPTAIKTIDGSGKIAFPGLISTHNHVFQNLCKGLGDELSFHPIVEGVILATAEEMNAEEIYIATLAACAEGVRSGRTTLLDFMVGLPDIELQRAVVRGFEDSGVRCVLGRATRELWPTASHRDPWYHPLDEALEQIRQLATEYDNGLPNPSAIPAPGNTSTMTTKGLERIVEFVTDSGSQATIHLAEYEAERTEGHERWGMATIAKLGEIGLLGPHLVAAHTVLVDDAELDILAETKTQVSYNPVSNCYIGAGIAPITRMLELGIDVSVAVDGSSVNTQNMLETLKFGALLQKADMKDPMALNARDMLHMATMAGARALGVPDLLGSIQEGRLADFFLFDGMNLTSAPVHDPISALVYTGGPQSVETVVVGGEVLLEDGKFVKIDEEAVVAELQERSLAVAKRANTERFVKGRRLTPFAQLERARNGHCTVC